MNEDEEEEVVGEEDVGLVVSVAPMPIFSSAVDRRTAVDIHFVAST